MKRMLESKAGMVMVAFKKIQNLRNMKIQSKGNLFEKGLSNFVNRVLRASF
jgi:hypothetical protein